MAKFTVENAVPGKSADFVYEAFNIALEQDGYEIWKKRPIAWLSLARKAVDGKHLDANLAVRMGAQTSYTFILSSEACTEEELAEIANKTVAVFEDQAVG